MVVGVGVRPRLGLAEQAGLADRSRSCRERLSRDQRRRDLRRGRYRALARSAFAASNIRVEHWVVAERQGQTAARNMLGPREVFDAVPFFWSQHYDVPINYVGHAEKWDEIAVDGEHRGPGLPAEIQEQGPRACGRLDLPRSCQPAG